MLTEQNKKDILSLFYRTELREGELVINNSDIEIAKELSLPYRRVAEYLTNHSRKKIDEFKNRYKYEYTEKN